MMVLSSEVTIFDNNIERGIKLLKKFFDAELKGELRRKEKGKNK